MRRLLLWAALLGLSWQLKAASTSPWYQGSVEAAFAQARKEDKPVFLYWGAVWCPPCNKLKSQVFSQPRFAALAREVVAVYLDGDSEAAQTWGERLQATGYPTLLLLSPQGQELLRLNTALTMDEFEQTFSAARRMKASVTQALADVRQDKADLTSWRALAHADWEDGKEWTPSQLLVIKQELYDKVPASLGPEKPIFAAQLVQQAANMADKKASLDETGKQALKVVEAQLLPLLDTVLNEQKAVLAARSLIIFNASRTMQWAATLVEREALRGLIKQWIAAAETIRLHPSMPVETRLWAIYPSLDLYRFVKNASAEGQPIKELQLPQALRQAIQAAVKLADHQAKTAYERQAVISGAADLLAQVEDYDGAAALLSKELQTSDSPWYYQLSLAHLEMERGRSQQALGWARQAKESVKGQATRLQWTVSYLSLATKLAADDIATIAALADEYYELALTMPDGFQGRNHSQAEQVAVVLAPLLPKHRKLARQVAAYRSRCSALSSGKHQNACRQHFEEVLAGLSARKNVKSR